MSSRAEKGDKKYGADMNAKNRYVVVLVMATVAGVFIDYVSTVAQSTAAARQVVAPTGRLRLGVYPGSPTSMIRGQTSGDEKGLTVDLGREFGRRLEVPVELVEFRQIADVLEALKRGEVDFTVTNGTPARANDMDFSGPILGVELGYLVPPRSAISAAADIDRPGVRVGVTAGSSSQATLSREFAHASVVPAPSLSAAVMMLAGGQIEAYATNKAILFEMSDQLPGSRVLDGRWGIELFAVAIPKGRGAALESVRMFADVAKSEGLVQRAAERAGMRGTVKAQ
jgi:polar amino acid transport system substrate-binding protein